MARIAPPSGAEPATVFVVDDDPAARDALSQLFESVNLTVEAFGTAAGALEAAEKTRAGCVVTDLRLPGASGLELLERMHAGPAPPPVILVTGYATVALAVRAMRAGAFDFLEKPFGHQDLLDRVHGAIRVDRANRARWAARDAARTRITGLSPREHEVYTRLVRGSGNKQIATALGLSVKTVEAHRARVCEKLGASHLGDLIGLALAAGLDCAGE